MYLGLQSVCTLCRMSYKSYKDAELKKCCWSVISFRERDLNAKSTASLHPSLTDTSIIKHYMLINIPASPALSFWKPLTSWFIVVSKSSNSFVCFLNSPCDQSRSRPVQLMSDNCKYLLYKLGIHYVNGTIVTQNIAILTN